MEKELEKFTKKVEEEEGKVLEFLEKEFEKLHGKFVKETIKLLRERRKKAEKAYYFWKRLLGKLQSAKKRERDERFREWVERKMKNLKFYMEEIEEIVELIKKFSSEEIIERLLREDRYYEYFKKKEKFHLDRIKERMRTP
ncbi:hypothetical protein DRN62_00660 [Nanoarchaeota archaeon]|nr:MAG: hypothetical protein DRN62_00660 [Nanoarchaeota archaeon]